MSSSSNIDANYIANLVQSVLDRQVNIDPRSETLYKELSEGLKTVVSTIKDSNNISKKELGEIVKLGKDITKANLDVTFTRKFEAIIKTLKDDISIQIGNNQSVNADKLVRALENVISGALDQSVRATNRGSKDSLIKGTKDNKKVKELIKEIGGLKAAFDDSLVKLMSFMGALNKGNLKKNKSMLDGVVDALAKSKFVGGALTDLIKLQGIRFAMFMSQFGSVGRAIGGLGYIIMDALAPLGALIVLGTLMNTHLRGLLKLVRFLGKAKGISEGAKVGAKAATNVGAKAVSSAGAKAVSSAGAKTASKVGLKVGGKAIAGAGAIFDIFDAVDSWKQGRKGNAAVFGLTALGSVVGLIAATLGATFGAPLLVVSAAVSIIATLWKAFHKRDEDRVEKEKEQKSWWQNFCDWIKDHWPFGDKGGGNSFPGPPGSENKGPLSVVTDKMGSKEVGSMGLKVSEDGGIINLANFNQRQASKALQEYEKADATRFNRVFEWADSRHANLNSFRTDAVKFNEKGQKTGALVYKGASKDLDNLKEYLGLHTHLSPNKIKALMITSGKMTAGNGNLKSSHKKGGFRSHNNSYALGFDLGGGKSWTSADYKAYLSAVQEFYGSRGFKVVEEGDHFDIKPISNWRPAGAVKNLNEQKGKPKVTSTKHSMTFQDLINDSSIGGGDAAYMKYLKEKRHINSDWYEKMIDEKGKENLQRDYLRHRGVRYERGDNGEMHYYTYKSLAKGVAVKDKEVITDPTGTDAYGKIKFKMQSVVNGAGN